MKAPGLLSSSGFAAVLLICLVLIVQYAGAWYWLEIIRVSKETELNRHLQDLGQVIQPQVRSYALEMADAADQIEQEIQIERLADSEEEAVFFGLYIERTREIPRQRLAELAARSRLLNLTILDDAGRVLFSNTDQPELLTVHDPIELEGAQFQDALNGNASGSLAYRVESAPLKRLYVPVMDDSGEVGAVLCLTAGRDYLAELDTLAVNIQVLCAIATALILVIGWLFHRLLSRQRKFERQAAHADRLSSLGSLAAGFAHEVRNPLEIIAACTEDLESSLAGNGHLPPEAGEACHDILEEVERLNRLVNQFLQYTKGESASDPNLPTPVRGCLQSAIGMIRHTADKRGISIYGPGEVPPEVRVKISETSLRQIVLNLVMNAVQAIPEGGEIQIVVDVEPRFVRLRVMDNGPGVPLEIQSRIFDPFFTTRPNGSGLGLSIAHQLATRGGGNLEYENRAGGGACFLLTLPREGRESALPLHVAQAVS